MTARKIRLMLVDDHALVRSGVRSLLELHDSGTTMLEVVGEAGSAEEALAVVAALAPDVVLLDLSLPGRSGLEALPDLRAAAPGARFVALSMHEEPEYVKRFLEGGGSGFVPKTSLEAQLVDAILAVARGEYYVPANLLAQLVHELAHPDPTRDVQLTTREEQVVTAIATGATYREIGTDLGLSEKTVATYRARASEKLGVRSRAELVRWALERRPL
ncbi:MAG: response regulator transcription factor [Trueperaceae bacterium]|nr:response regulator transcription factor [Trueperaceae bacterium]